MATFLDVTMLENFSIIFVFILVWVIIYAILSWSKVLGQNHALAAVLGFVVAILAIMSDLMVKVIIKVAPVFALVLVFFMIIRVGVEMLGGHMNDSSIAGLKWTVIIVLVIALIIGTAVTIRDAIDVPDTGEDFDEVSTVFFHPNFLGLILVFLIAVFSVGLLAGKTS